MPKPTKRKVVIDSPDLLTLDDAAPLLDLNSPATAHYHVRRAGVALVRLGRVQAIRREDLPRLAAALAESRMRGSNVRQGLSPDGQFWGSERVANALGVSVRTLKRLAGKGVIPPAVQQDGKWWWSPEEVTRAAADGAIRRV